nr:leucine-rich repeat-containing protein 37B [Loxodonta africana]
MSRLCLWDPRVLLMLQALWLLFQAPPFLAWAQNLVLLNSDPPGLTEPRSLPSPDFPPESPVQQGAPTRLPEAPKVEERFPRPQETPAHTPEAPEENEPPLTPQEAQTQPLTPPNAVIPQTSVPHEVSLRPPGQNQTHHSTLSNITIQPVDMELTLTPERMKEVQSCPTQQEAPAQPPKPPQEVKPSSSQQEAPAQPPTPPQEAEPFPGQQKAPFQPPNATEEVEASPTQQESPALPPQSPEEVASSSVQQEVPAQSPMLPQEVKPSPTQQQTPAQTPEPPEEVEPFPVQQEAPALPPKPLEECGASPVQQESPALPPEPSQEVEPSPTQQETIAQSLKPPQEVKPSIQEGTPGLPPQQPEEFEASPVQQEAPAQPPKPSEEVEASPGLQEAPAQLPKPPQEVKPPSEQEAPIPPPEPPEQVEPSPVQQEVPAQPAKPPQEVKPPIHHEAQAQPPKPSEVQQEYPVQLQDPPDDSQPSPVKQEDLPQFPEPNKKGETSPTPQEDLAQSPELLEYNGTFTVLNFQGNSIFYIEENIWKAYHWTEKLILSENCLTELHKDSFEGLLSIQYLDLSCNKIQSIERRTFEPLPFLLSVNLGCNLITELGFGTFQAWHGMQFLHTLVLNRNPLTAIEDSYLFKLPALKYLDMGTTQVSLTTVENILIMTLKLEKLILPSHMACCLCQFKSTIEVVCKTVKLRCDSECLINSTRCSEEASLGPAEGTFMKALQARKKNTSTELTIEPEAPHGSSLPLLSSLGDQFETQLNQQLQSLIPNKDVRRLIAHVMRTLKLDCSEPQVQLACAKLLSRTGLLMKLLSEQQEVKVSKADWDTDQWKTENYINKSTDVQSEQKEQESSELTKEVPGYGYNHKLILAISVTVVVMILIIIFCLIELVGIKLGQRPSLEALGKGKG